MSHATASESPAPAHTPLTAAITGFSSARIASTFGWYVSCSDARTSGISWNSVRSWPAQKPRPAPVRTTARTSGSAASFNAARSAACIARLNALSTSGRFSVIVWTLPSRVTSTSAIAWEPNPTAAPTPRAPAPASASKSAGCIPSARKTEKPGAPSAWSSGT